MIFEEDDIKTHSYVVEIEYPDANDEEIVVDSFFFRTLGEAVKDQQHFEYTLGLPARVYKLY